MIHYIYTIVNTANNKVYVGYTSRRNPLDRWKSHVKDASKLNRPLYQSMRKHGIENFVFQVIFCSKDGLHTLKTMENYFITEYKSHVSTGRGYNLTMGGQSNAGWVPSDETRQVWSAQRKGIRFHTAETRETIGATQKIRYRNQPELKEQLRKRALELGIRPPPPTTDTHIKSGLSRKGQSYHTEERKRKLSEAVANPNHPFNGVNAMNKRKQTWKTAGRGLGPANGNAVFCDVFNNHGQLVASGFLREQCDNYNLPFNKFLAASRHGKPLERGEWKGWRIERISKR